MHIQSNVFDLFDLSDASHNNALNKMQVIYCKDKEGRYIDCNPIFEQFSGLSKVEILGNTDFNLPPISPTEATTFRNNDLSVTTLERNHLFIEPSTKYDGTKCVSFSYKSPLFSKLNPKKLMGSIGITLIIENYHFFPVDLYNSLVAELAQDTLLSRRQFDCLYYLILGMTKKQNPFTHCFHQFISVIIAVT